MPPPEVSAALPPVSPLGRPAPARITLNETVAWAPPGGQQALAAITHRTGSFVRVLANLDPDDPNHHMWRREMVVGADWTSIDLGWVGDSDRPPAMIFVVNLEDPGRGPNGGIPTAEHKALVLGRVVLVGVQPESGVPVVAFDRIAPPESGRLTPVPGARYLLKSAGTPAKVLVVVLPGGEG